MSSLHFKRDTVTSAWLCKQVVIRLCELCRDNIKTVIKNTLSLIVDLCFSDRHKQATFYGLSMYSLIHKILKFLLFQGALPSIIDYYLLQFSDLALSPLSTEILLLSCRLKYLSYLSSFDLVLNAIPRYMPFLVNI